MDAVNVETKNAKPQRKLGVAAIGTGLVFGGMAGGACWVDVTNNFKFGAGMSHELGIVFGLSALALTLLPASKPMLKGHHDALRVVRIGTWIALAMTVLAALSAHMDKQAADRMHRKAQNDTYATRQASIATARQDYESAQTRATQMTELVSSSDLEALANQAEANARQADADADKEAGNKFCGKNCLAHQEKRDGYRREASAYRERIGRAKAREADLAQAQDAKQRLEKADGSESSGPAETSPLATTYADQFGIDRTEAVQHVELLTAILSIFATMSLAFLGHPAVALIRYGLSNGGEVEPDLDGRGGAKQPPANKPAKMEKKPARGRRARTPEDLIMDFAAARLRKNEGEVTGGQVNESFNDWWRSACPGQTMPTMNMVAAVLTEKAGIEKERRGGKIRYKAMLVAH